MYKSEQLLEKLIGTLSKSRSPERGHELVPESPTFGPSRPHHITYSDEQVSGRTHGFGLSVPICQATRAHGRLRQAKSPPTPDLLPPERLHTQFLLKRDVVSAT